MCLWGALLWFSAAFPAAQQPATATWSESAALAGHIDAVRGLAFSPDGRLLVSSSDDASLRVWEIDSRAQRAERYEHGSFVKAVAFVPGDARRPYTLVSGGWDRSVIFWALAADGQIAQQQQLAGYPGVIDHIALASSGTSDRTPDGTANATWLAFSVGDGTVRLNDALTYAEQHTLMLDGGFQVTALAFDPTGRRLATAAGFPAQTTQLWSSETGDLLGQLAVEGVVSALVWVDETRLVIGLENGQIQLWALDDPGDPALLAELPPGDWVTRLAYQPEQRWLAAARLDGTVEVWDMAEPAAPVQLARLPDAHPGGAYALAFQPGGDTPLLATGGGDSIIRLWTP